MCVRESERKKVREREKRDGYVRIRECGVVRGLVIWYITGIDSGVALTCSTTQPKL